MMGLREALGPRAQEASVRAVRAKEAWDESPVWNPTRAARAVVDRGGAVAVCSALAPTGTLEARPAARRRLLTVLIAAVVALAPWARLPAKTRSGLVFAYLIVVALLRVAGGSSDIAPVALLSCSGSDYAERDDSSGACSRPPPSCSCTRCHRRPYRSPTRRVARCGPIHRCIRPHLHDRPSSSRQGPRAPRGTGATPGPTSRPRSREWSADATARRRSTIRPYIGEGRLAAGSKRHPTSPVRRIGGTSASGARNCCLFPTSSGSRRPSRPRSAGPAEHSN